VQPGRNRDELLAGPAHVQFRPSAGGRFGEGAAEGFDGLCGIGQQPLQRLHRLVVQGGIVDGRGQPPHQRIAVAQGAVDEVQ
jgi:hypothetical protein